MSASTRFCRAAVADESFPFSYGCARIKATTGKVRFRSAVSGAPSEPDVPVRRPAFSCPEKRKGRHFVSAPPLAERAVKVRLLRTHKNSYVLRCQGVKEHFLNPHQTPASYPTFERPTIVRWGPPNGNSNGLKTLGAQCCGVLPRLLVWFAIKMPAFRAFPFAGTQEPLPMRTRIGKVSR